MNDGELDATRSFSPSDGGAAAEGGAAEGVAAQPAPARPTDAPADIALLTVIGGDLPVGYFALTSDEALIGRSGEAAVVLDDVTVSRQHAKLVRNADSWLVTDLRSLNGTYVNKSRVEKVALKDGDELQIGKFRFVFVSPAGK